VERSFLTYGYREASLLGASIEKQ